MQIKQQSRHGQALAVDRDEFSKLVTQEIAKIDNIEVIREEYTNDLNEKDGIVIIATGPLTSDKMTEKINHISREAGDVVNLFFYDASSPIIEKDTINMDIAFMANRYGNGVGTGALTCPAYINLPMNKEEYEKFYNNLINAEVVHLHEFEKKEIFEGCMPIEVMAARGIDTIRFGPLKPMGFIDPKTGKRPYAVVQLRQDNQEGTLYNIVGFQTNLKFGEQKRVFSIIPGLENAEFVKYGVMHRNTYINSPVLLDNTYNLKTNSNIFFAGQITGVEGYVESISSGLVAGVNAVQMAEGRRQRADKIVFPNTTMIGALAEYISSPNERFQPMNANFGILPELEEKVRDKQIRYSRLSQNSLESINTFNIYKIIAKAGMKSSQILE